MKHNKICKKLNCDFCYKNKNFLDKVDNQILYILMVFVPLFLSLIIFAYFDLFR